MILTINSFDQLYTVYSRFKQWPIREDINPSHIYNEIYLSYIAPSCTNYRTHGMFGIFRSVGLLIWSCLEISTNVAFNHQEKWLSCKWQQVTGENIIQTSCAYTFAGVSIGSYLEKLAGDYNLEVTIAMDLQSSLAVCECLIRFSIVLG
nr:hypothetical protein Iba_chr03fCG2610 [Ipomoea batatas]